MIKLKFPLFTFNGVHWVKHLTPNNCIVVTALNRIEERKFENATTVYFDDYFEQQKGTEKGIVEVTQEEFNLVLSTTAEHFKQLN